MSCMSGSPNLNSFRDRGQVAVQLVSCGVLLPGLVQESFRKNKSVKVEHVFFIIVFKHHCHLGRYIFLYNFPNLWICLETFPLILLQIRFEFCRFFTFFLFFIFFFIFLNFWDEAWCAIFCVLFFGLLTSSSLLLVVIQRFSSCIFQPSSCHPCFSEYRIDSTRKITRIKLPKCDVTTNNNKVEKNSQKNETQISFFFFFK